MEHPNIKIKPAPVKESCCEVFINRKELTVVISGPGMGNATLNYYLSARSMISLRDVLLRNRITLVILHRSGIFWKLVYDILIDHFTIRIVSGHDLPLCCQPA
jgi:hypothetical protein